MTRPLTITELNDMFRQSGIGGRLFITAGIDALSKTAYERVLHKVQNFDHWDEGDDPYGEHDFGAFDDPEAGKVFWKIDYYDASMEMGSEDPADPKRTTRVLTIMLASEY
jgi:hypothetical protein